VNGLREKLLRGERLLGTIVSVASPQVSELLAQAGFDWLFIDAEHGLLEASAIQDLIRAAGATPCLVRVPSLDEVAIKQVLDAGAEGIIVPQVNSADAAKRAVAYAKYPPLGQRGVGIARAQGYGFELDDYLARANERITVVVQAEHIEAVANIEDIAVTPGVDAVFVGPYDLAASLDRMGRVTDREVVQAIDHITRACQANDTRLGVFGASADAVNPYIAQGFTLIAAGTDTLLLGRGARELLEKLL